MNDYQRGRAIDQLLVETEFDEEELEQYADEHLDTWLYELGFDWDDDAGCYVYMEDEE